MFTRAVLWAIATRQAPTSIASTDVVGRVSLVGRVGSSARVLLRARRSPSTRAVTFDSPCRLAGWQITSVSSSQLTTSVGHEGSCRGVICDGDGDIDIACEAWFDPNGHGKAADQRPGLLHGARVVVIAQLAYWVRTKEGRQRQALQAWLTRLVEALHGRVHGFNVSVAQVWAEQERQLDRAGQRMPVEDSYIAATARRHSVTIVTGNDRDLRRPGLTVSNLFKELP